MDWATEIEKHRRSRRRNSFQIVPTVRVRESLKAPVPKNEKQKHAEKLALEQKEQEEQSIKHKIDESWQEFTNKAGKARLGVTPGSLSPWKLREVYPELDPMLTILEPAGQDEQKNDSKSPSKIKGILQQLRSMQTMIGNILEHSEHLGGDILEEFRGLNKQMDVIHEQIIEDDSALDRRNAVEALVDFTKLPYDFTSADCSDRVEYHRASAVSRRAVSRAPSAEALACPVYLSQAPLPTQSDSCTLIVQLPALLTVEEKRFTTTVTARDTVARLLTRLYTEYKNQGLREFAPLESLSFKVFGQQNYLPYSEHSFFDFDYIRSQIRDGEPARVILVSKPSPPPVDPTAPRFDLLYQAKVDPGQRLLAPTDHQGLTARLGNWQELAEIGRLPMSEMNVPFGVKIEGIDSCIEESLPRIGQIEGASEVAVETFLFNGCSILTGSQHETEVLPLERALWWGEHVRLGRLIDIPRTARIAFLVWSSGLEKKTLLGWVVQNLIDQYGVLMSGPRHLRLWSIPADKKGKHGKKRDLDPSFVFRATTSDNQTTDAKNQLLPAATLRLRFDQFAAPVVAPMIERYRQPNPQAIGAPIPRARLSASQDAQLTALIAADPLTTLSTEDKKLIWMMRHCLVEHPRALPKFLQSVDWRSPECSLEARRLLSLWAPPNPPSLALELLDAKYPDPSVRAYAVDCLRALQDEDLRSYLLQLTQCLKFESYHDSYLAQFLIDRALAAPIAIGHYLFWHLQAELHEPTSCERFSLILEEYLSFAGKHAAELRKQTQAVHKLQAVAEMIVNLKREHGYGDEQAMKEYTKEITRLNSDFFAAQGKFQQPLNPKVESLSPIVNKCRYMSSKMVPLWLVFENADTAAPPTSIIFKSGDDLRQDILTLQMLTLMDKMWLQNGLDLKMRPYRVIATGVNKHGEGVGMIEVVQNSDTLSNIQIKYGGGAMGALKNEPIDNYLKEHNPGKEAYEKAVDNFICSCAGYCVATYVLGIGDRHNGNIMVTKDGHLFHIDFGHFLGNFKKKFGFDRERAAFVFTPEMAYVMGGKRYKKSPMFKKFLHLCVKAYTELRVNAHLLEVIFQLMQAAGMPELMVEKDILYMREKLCLDQSEQEAHRVLQSEIQKSLDTTYRRIDNLIHNMVHG